MKATFRQSMTWLHTWAGLLLGWVSFAIFLTGTATYFRGEITRWMQPELRSVGTPLDAARAAVARLARDAAASPSWFVDLPDGRQVATTLVWRNPAGGRGFERVTIDPVTGADVVARDSRGGEFFYRFHFQLQLPYPWGRYLACLAALAMFVALISGIVTHRRFFADFFTFRAGRGSGRAWLDFHNVTAVLALPFYLMITYSALVIFIGLVMPWGTKALTPPPTAADPVATDLAENPTPPAWITPAPLGPMLELVEQAWGADGRTLKRIEVVERGTAGCTVKFTRAAGPHVSLGALETLRFDGDTGALLDEPPAAVGLGRATHDVLYGLHLARFAGPALRGLFAVMGLAGTALIATGLVLWTIKRRPRQRGARLSFGHGLVERLNITTIAGLPVACAAFLWANRLLPVGLDARGDWEVHIFLCVWAATLLHPWIRPVMAAWREQLWLGAALCVLLPALDAVTATAHLRDAWHDGNRAHLGLDVTLPAIGLLLACGALRVGRRIHNSATERTAAVDALIDAAPPPETKR